MSITFAALGVPADLARSLAERGIDAPFPIQAATIPDALAGRDLCGKAPTGSGKTIAFGIPMVLGVTRSAPKRPHGLVLCPTRELAIQVADELKALTTDLRVLAVYGGAKLDAQIKAMRRGVDIVVACPGRLGDLIERRVCDLRDVTLAVVDEADRMADMGFLPDVKRLLDQTSAQRQTLLFSATLDGAVDELVKRYQHDPAVHEMDEEESADVVHHFWKAERADRVALAAKVVRRSGPTIIFCRTRHGADRVAKQLGKLGVTAAAIHGDRSQSQRERALNAFHRGEVATLVATDVAARGIHVTGVQCVLHFDLPADPKDYVHRSGRTGRAGAEGTVVAFVGGDQQRDAAKLRRDAGVVADLVAPDLHAIPLDGEPELERTARVLSEPRLDAGSRPAAAPRAKSPVGSARGERPPKLRANGEPATRPPSRDFHDRSSSRERDDRPVTRGRSERPAPRRDDAARPERPARGAGRFRDVAPTGKASGGVSRERFDRSPSDGRSDRPKGKAYGTDRAREIRPAGKTGGDRPYSKSHRAPSDTDALRGGRPVGKGDPSKPAARPKAVRVARDDAPDRRPDLPLELDAKRSAPSGPGGHQKVRPSGAARRKAKRDAQVAAGEAPTRAKRKRSGRPRPPAASRKSV